jgi:hypothetical protein
MSGSVSNDISTYKPNKANMAHTIDIAKAAPHTRRAVAGLRPLSSRTQLSQLSSMSGTQGTWANIGRLGRVARRAG